MSKAIIHLMSFNRINSKVFKGEIPLLIDLYENYGVNNIVFYLGSEKLEIEYLNSLKKKGITFKNYLGDNDLNKKIIKISKKYKNIFITTLAEISIGNINNLKKLLGQKVSSHIEMFSDKSIQRELLFKNDSEISVKFIKNSITKLNFDNIKGQIGLPFVLKPSNGTHSAGVVKINNSREFDEYIKNYVIFHEKILDKGFYNSDVIIAEEYVDGKFFSIDYYVDENGKILRSNPIKVTLGTDLGIPDFFNCARIISSEVEKEFTEQKLDDFISRNVEATGIKNTFIHHEFKINSKGKYKTIEINGRIGGNRLSIYNLGYDLNLYSFIYKNKNDNKIFNNIVYLRVYSHINGILEGFNEELFSKIEKLKSTFEIKKRNNDIGKNTGLTKFGFEHPATIKMKNKNLEEIKKDLKFIEDNYKDLLIVKEG